MDIDTMVKAYAECALWSSLDEDDQDENGNPAHMDEHYSTDDLADETLDKFREDCEAFAEANETDLEQWSDEQAGHDFWLTRNGHGAGFWDRGLGEPGERLTKAAHVYGEVNLYVRDGRIYSDA